MTNKQLQVVIFSGAGVSAESGLKTFRDNGGLWEQFRVEDVASIDAWHRDPETVLRFYNMRFQQLQTVKPNAAHFAIAEMEKDFNVRVITQNVDNLHEKAGSTNVLHLHGELASCKSSKEESLVYPMPEEGLKLGDLCEKGHQLRPNIVWFGEMVTELDKAANIAAKADIFITVGTSLNVYPAAGIVQLTSDSCKKYLVDPGEFEAYHLNKVEHIKEKASVGVPKLLQVLREEYI